jgi:hypothetical protein
MEKEEVQMIGPDSRFVCVSPLIHRPGTVQFSWSMLTGSLAGMNSLHFPCCTEGCPFWYQHVRKRRQFSVPGWLPTYTRFTHPRKLLWIPCNSMCSDPSYLFLNSHLPITSTWPIYMLLFFFEIVSTLKLSLVKISVFHYFIAWKNFSSDTSDLIW